jgi:hypothetical protein
MTASKLYTALAPIAIAGAFAAGLALNQRHAPASPNGILGAGVYVPANTAQQGLGHPGGFTRPGIGHGGWNHPGGWSHPGGFTKPGYAHPGGFSHPGGFARP